MDIANKTLSELRAIASERGIIPTGHRGHKRTWISAIENSPGVDRQTAPNNTHEAPNNTTAYFTDEQPPNRGDGKGRIESIESSDAPWQPNSEECRMIAEMFLFAAGVGPEIEASDCLIDASPPESGITLSSRFVTLYSPPSTEKQFVPDETGQLSLLNFTEEEEPPDPDDFEGNMFAFWAAYDDWCDRHPDIDVSEFSEPLSQPSEPIEIELTSMCEWAPCPMEWYEPAPPEVSELSLAIESSSTYNFSIPTFDAWCDRQNDTDEPPDTEIFARLPKPKPPSFPPQAIGSDTKKCFNANRHTTRSTIAVQAHIIHFATDSSSQSGRSPPGGDARTM